jgi:hypothetical protein
MSNRNILKVGKHTRYNERTGNPSIIWIASVRLSAGPYLSSTARLSQKESVRDLKSRLSELKASCERAIQRLEKENPQ